MPAAFECAITPSLAERKLPETLAREAWTALARLDLDQLEELAVRCDALAGTQMHPEDAQAVLREMAVFRKMLQTTRTNLDVIRLLHDRRIGSVEYELPDRGRTAEEIYGHD